MDADSEVSMIPPQVMEDHRMQVENLKWQIDYEKKLHMEMSQLLENKVSHLMAEVKQLKKQIVDLETQISEHESVNLTLTQNVQRLEDKVSD